MDNMPRNDAFALKNSGLNAFLFADVGTEQNGSPLTILSTLARLGKDPWAQAADWAKMPNAAKVDGLTRSIAQMPLCPHDLAEARITAGRLVMLLPGLAATTVQTANRAGLEFKLPEWLPLALFVVLLGVVAMAPVFVAASNTPAPVAVPAPSIQQGQ
jgi:hypothetical protein